MAFHQPTRQIQQRLARIDSAEPESSSAAAALAPQTRLVPDESQTWVLFSPATDAGTTTSYITSSVEDEDQPTPGRSRISDIGSLNSVPRSDLISQPRASATEEASDLADESFAEDDAELDSLDSHLPSFRTTPSPYSQQAQQQVAHAAPVFPNHDGLGSFRLEQGMNVDAQEHLYAFERFNPRRLKRRRESLELAQLALENTDEAEEVARNRRIEAWRLEHSQFLLHEIQRETRRRRHSGASTQKTRSVGAVMEEVASLSGGGEAAHEGRFTGNEWHDQDTPGMPSTHEGLWSRITRKFIRDLMGIDDKLLTILFGEAVGGETEVQDDELLSSTPKASAMNASAAPAWLHDMGPEASQQNDLTSDWRLQMLDRIARKLGVLVHQMSTHHPGAFSTYQHVHQMPIPYAGLPVIPEGAAETPVPGTAGEVGGESLEKKPEEGFDSEVPSMPQFQPTITRPLDVPSMRPSDGAPTTTFSRAADVTAATTSTPQTFTQEEWEQDLDIKLVFRYLRSRFTSSRATSTSFTSGTSHLGTSGMQDAAAKAARVRQHHPLVHHAYMHQRQTRPAAERRTFKATTPASPVALRHPSGSCASQSTRRSARRSSVSSRHSSRHYWDIGGSIGTGSMIASAGPMGSWGD